MNQALAHESPALSPIYFGIDEGADGAWVRLRLTGELDLASSPVLKHRLAELREKGRPVRLDLSGLEFIDSSGIHVLIGAFNEGRADSWDLEIEPSLSRQVARTLRLINVERIVTGLPANGQWTGP